MASFPTVQTGTRLSTRKVEVQVTGVWGDGISLQQRHVQCHGIRKGDVNHHHLSDLLVTKQDFLFSGILNSLLGIAFYSLMVPRLLVGNSLLNFMMTRGKIAFNSKANSESEAGDGAQMDRMLKD